MQTDEDKYRVVCSRDSFDGEYYIDIIPAQWAIHQVIMDVRKNLNSHAEDVAGAVFLYDKPGSQEPEIEFLAKKDRFLLTDYWPYDETVFPKMKTMIKEKFAQMKADGIVTTISRYDLDDYYGNCVANQETEFPRSSGGERLLKAFEEKGRRQRIDEDKKIRDSKDHIDPITKLKWKQLLDCER